MNEVYYKKYLRYFHTEVLGNAQLDTGIFEYVMNAKCESSGALIQRKGNVTLLK